MSILAVLLHDGNEEEFHPPEELQKLYKVNDKLEKIVGDMPKGTPGFLQAGSWLVRPVRLSPVFSSMCQVWEAMSDDTMTPFAFPEHTHDSSYTVIYQLEGTSSWEDGEVLSPFHCKVIPPNKTHGGLLSRGARCLIITHPPEKLYDQLHS